MRNLNFIKMKKVIFLVVFVLTALISNAQITNVQREGSKLYVYGENNRKIASIFNNGTLGGITSVYRKTRT